MTDNSSNNKRIAKNTMLLYFRMLFLMAISLYTSRVILEALGVVDYGIYNVVGGFVAMFSLVSSSLTSACMRFLNYEMGAGNKDRLKKVFSSSVTIHYILAVIIAVLCETIGLWYINNKLIVPDGRLYAANIVFQISVLNFCTNLITIPYNSAIVAHERMKTFAYVSIFEGIGRLLICFLIMWLPYDHLISYATLYLIIQFSVRAMYQHYCRKNFDECKYVFELDKPLLKQMFSYSGWHILGNSAAIINRQGIDLVLNAFFGPVLNASRGIANQVSSAVSQFSGNFMMALNPQITQQYAKGDTRTMLQLVYRGARFSFYVLFILSLPITINADFILQLWLVEVPEYSVQFVQLSLAVSMFTAFSNTLTVAQNATGKVKIYQIVISSVLLLTLPLSYLVLKLGCSPVMVMAVAIFIEFLCLTARLVVIPSNIPELNPLDFCRAVVWNCLKVVIFASIIPITLRVVCINSILNSVINILASLMLASLCVLFIGCSKNERTSIFNYVIKFIKR